MERVNTGFFSKIEERILWDLAKKMPAFFNPDWLTLLGFCCGFFASLCYLLAGFKPGFLFVASFFIFCNWLTDGTDGKVAKVRKCSRPRYGFYTDHIIDAISLSLMIIGITLSQLTFSSIWYFVLVLMLLLMMQSYLLTGATNIFHLAIGIFGGTEARALFIIINLLGFFLYQKTFWIKAFKLSFFDIAGIVAVILLLIIFTIGFVNTSSQLKAEDEKKIQL